MVPVFLNKIPGIKNWNAPMDFGYSWREKRIFGPNKRIRGIVFGTLLAGFTAVIVAKLNANTIVTIEPFLVGCLLGFGALIGDAIESFFKRQKDIAPGQSWFAFDQTDYIIGALLLILPFVQLPLWAIVTIFFVYFGLHLVVAYIGYRIGLKNKPI